MVIVLGGFILVGCNSNSSGSSSDQNAQKSPQSTQDKSGAPAKKSTDNNKEDRNKSSQGSTTKNQEGTVKSQSDMKTSDRKQQKNDNSSGSRERKGFNSSVSSNQKPNSLPQGISRKKYKDQATANNKIDGYHRIKQTNVDLGHDVKAFGEASTGDAILVWNEGRWLIEVDYPTDKTRGTKRFPSGMELAKKIVAYLDTHSLPAPHDKGTIKVRDYKDSYRTTVQWQEGKSVYSTKSKGNNPIEVLKKVVSMHSRS
jgi:hypothetical protein